MEADDSELAAERGTSGIGPPAHRQPRFVALVALGGALGTGLRYGVVLAVPPVAGIPVAVLAVNLLGALLLGGLLESLAAVAPDHGWGRRLRLGLGTGVLGGFTTYSTLAVDTVDLGGVAPTAALAYGTGSVLLGILAAALGIVLARRLLRGRVTARWGVRP